MSKNCPSVHGTARSTVIWLPSVIFSVVVLCLLPDKYSYIITFPGIVGLVLITLVYIRIHLTTRRHKNQIQALQVQDVSGNNKIASSASLVKFAVGTFYVNLVILICYLPMLICLVATEINGPSIPLKSWFIFSVTLFLLGFPLNPVIYCWKMRHIRDAIMDILRNLSWHKNWVSHLF